MKKIIFFTILIFTFLIIAQNCLAVDLLLNWPEVNEQKLGQQSSIPDLISYIYKFALAICGITALVSIVIGAAQYAFSAGDSSKMTDAKDRITQALLGIVILLFAVLILNTINPDLVNLNFSIPKINTPAPKGPTQPFVQCVVSGATECPSGKVIYKACVAGVGNLQSEMIKDCETRCKGEGDTPTGTKKCNYYGNKTGCKTVSAACVNP